MISIKFQGTQNHRRNSLQTTIQTSALLINLVFCMIRHFFVFIIFRASRLLTNYSCVLSKMNILIRLFLADKDISWLDKSINAIIAQLTTY